MTVEKKDNGMAKWGLTLSILGGILIPLLIGIGTLIVSLKTDIATLQTQISAVDDLKRQVQNLWYLGQSNKDRIGSLEVQHGYRTNSVNIPNIGNEPQNSNKGR